MTGNGPLAFKPVMGKDVCIETLEEGLGDDKTKIAEYHSVVTYDFKGYFIDGSEDGEDGMMSKDLVRRDEPFEEMTNHRAQIGESDTIMGLELALRTNGRPGAVFRVRIHGKYGYGSQGRKEVDSSEGEGVAIPPMQKLEYVVTVSEVVGIDEFYKSNPATGRNATYEDLCLRKEVGNRYFYYADYVKAARSYSKGASKGDAHYGQSPRDNTPIDKKIWEVYVSCLNNLSACHISSGEFFKAKEVCVKVLELEDTNIKALLRGARASLALSLFEECEACIARVLQLEPSNELALKERTKLNKAKREAKSKKRALDKQMSKNMFERNTHTGGQGLLGEQRTGNMSPKSDQEKDLGGIGVPTGTQKTIRSGDKSAAPPAPAPAPRNTNGYGESSNMLLLLSTAVIILALSVWLAWSE